MASTSTGARKRQRTVGDSSDEDVSDALSAVLEDDEEDDDLENEAEINDAELQELEEEEEEGDEEEADEDADEDAEDEVEDEVEEDVEEDESVDDNDEEIDDDEVPDPDEEDPSLDDDQDDPDDGGDESDTPAESSRYMTTRQRKKQMGTTANLGIVDLDELGSSNRSKKKALSAEEQRIKRAEMARRRRNLSKQRLEEEKQDTLDKLLKKRAGKVRGDTDESGEPMSKAFRSRLVPPHPALLSWQSTKHGSLLSMTEERAKFERL